MEILSIGEGCRSLANALLKERWYSTRMVIRGEIVDLAGAEGFLALDDGQPAGLITYRFLGEDCEITSLDSLRENRGLGTLLTGRVISLARRRGCARVLVVTTNDNLRAIRFYQRRGFDLARLYRGALDRSRLLKPEIPLIGQEGIPLQHELEFEMLLRG